MIETRDAAQTRLQKTLDLVERAGNKVPHPAAFFFLLIGAVIALSNPLLPHFALVVGFAQRWQKDAGVGTVVAMMLPYTAATLVAWTLLFFAWYFLGLSFGPG